MTLQKSKLSREYIKDLSRQNKEPEWLTQKRLEAFSAYQQLELNAVYGLGITLDFSNLNLEVEPPEIEHLKIKSGDAEVLDINEALPQVKDYLFSTLEKEKISCLHAALFNKGLFIRVPKGVETKLLFENDLQSNSFENLLIVLEPLSKLEFIENNTSKKNNLLRSQITEIFAKEGSRIDFASIQQYPQTINNFVNRKAIIEKDATINWVSCDLGGSLSKSDMTTFLKGPGSSVFNKNLFFGSGNQQFGIAINAIHDAPNTKSDLATKGALNDRAKGLYTGLIKINPDAAKSVGYQREDVLQLSEEAESNAIPNLEIGNEDVKCSHGATTGQINKEKIFYLMSRGIPEQEARNKIVEGFFEPLITGIQIEKIQDEIRKIIEKKLRKGDKDE